MKIYFEKERLIIDDGVNLIKHTPSKGLVAWENSPDGLTVSIKSATCTLVDDEIFSGVTDKVGGSYTQESFESMLEPFFLAASSVLDGLRLVAPTTVSNGTDWTDITGTYDSYGTSKYFEQQGVELVYSGPNTTGVMVGSSNLKVSKVSDLEYGLVVNGALKVRTEHSFRNANAVEHISATGPFALNTGDRIKVQVKSSVTGNGLDIDVLDVSIFTTLIL